MKFWHITLIGVLVVTALAGCGGEEATPAPVDAGADETYTGAVLDTSYANALPVSSQLALGTFLLEETGNAVTPEQAAALLPLWQAIQAGTLQSETETNAVLKQIEGMMTSEQLTSIAAQQLTWEDFGGWAEEQGLNMGLSPEAMATRQAEGGSGPLGNMSEEERAAMRATMEAGGMPFGGDPSGSRPSGNLSEEERAAMRATAEAGGMSFGGQAGAGGGQLALLAEPLIELLTQRAGS